MFRLIFMTFHGEYRGDPKVFEHAHEAPPTMTIPLIILAIPSIFTGFVMGFPPDNGHIDHFLEPVFEFAMAGEHHVFAGMDLALMGLSALVGLSGIALAWLFYIKRTDLPQKAGEKAGVLYRMILNKYWVDEIYAAVFINPLRKVSDWLWHGFDEAGIDGFVNGMARFFRGVGNNLKPTEAGEVHAYLLNMFLGLLLIMVAYVILSL
jgi:NADH-quinone oxidoreductase subunit L